MISLILMNINDISLNDISMNDISMNDISMNDISLNDISMNDLNDILHKNLDKMIQKYSENDYVFGRLVNYMENLLPTALENATDIQKQRDGFRSFYKDIVKLILDDKTEIEGFIRKAFNKKGLKKKGSNKLGTRKNRK